MRFTGDVNLTEARVIEITEKEVVVEDGDQRRFKIKPAYDQIREETYLEVELV